jgi:DNA-binding transcriptional ArsR family regulator/uncharacterized protein YndB with AHSA1/START domain
MRLGSGRGKQGQDGELLPLWKALADPTRRRVLDLLRERPATTGDIARAFPTTRFAIMKHLTVLAEAGLVVARKQGRERWNHLNPLPLQQLYERWIRPYEAEWSSRALRLQSLAERSAEQAKKERTMGAASRVEECGIARVALDVSIGAPPERVWKALVEETSAWWPRDFYAIPESRRFVIEPRVGGRMYEESASGAGCLWATVIVLEPGRILELQGYLTPAFGGPAVTIYRLELVPDGRNTLFKVSDSVFGAVSGRTAASLESGWRSLFDGGLRRHAEESVARETRKRSSRPAARGGRRRGKTPE